jgi:uncharacterized Zn-binding protein involved in type VI secretion
MPIGARKNSIFMVVNLVPDVCKTPIGPNLVPVPYPIIGDLNNSITVAKHTNFNGDPVYLLSDSVVTTVTGNEPGTGGGIKSGVNKGKVRATSSSKSVRVEGKFVVRHGDECEMNLAS